MKQEYNEISPEAQKLLSREEGYDVDFKRDINGLHGEDLIAFANSKTGGSILVGIDEYDDNGRQKTRIVGCPVGDKDKQKIKSKAQNCIPPVDIEIFIENSNKKPFYRVEIPSGNKKPYCTQKGIYKLRDDGNNKVLSPDRLLSMFIEIESQIFIDRFKKAAVEIENNLDDIASEVSDAISSLEEIMPRLDDLEEYSLMSDEILGTVNEIHNETDSANYIAYWNQERIIAVLNHFNIEDPYITNLKESVQGLIKYDFDNREPFEKDEYLKRLKHFFPRIKEDTLKLWYEEKVKELNK